MPPTSSQQQTHYHTQTYHSGYVRGPGPSTARVPDNIPPRYAQPLTPHYDSQRTQDGFRNPTPPRFQRGDDAYSGWGNATNGLNYHMTETLRTEAPPPRNGGECAPYGHFGQGGINHTGFPFVAEPPLSLETNIPHPFPGTGAAPSNQGPSPVWKVYNYWVDYEAQDELRLTVVIRKGPFA